MILFRFWVHDSDQGYEWHPTISQARKAAFDVIHRDDTVQELDIEQCDMVPLTRENFIEILNSGGGRCVRTHKVVDTVRRRRIP